MEYSKQLVSKIFFDDILPATTNGYIEIPIYDDLTKTSEKHTFNINLTLDSDSEFYLNITNKEKFIDLLYEYVTILLSKNIEDKTDVINKIKLYLTLIWSNATYSDLNNPNLFIQKYIDFENNKLFKSSLFASNIKTLNNSDIYITISHQNCQFETPYLFELTIKNGDKEYYLPSISYGISNGCCYIYASQNKKIFSNNFEYEKKIKRLLYKINAGLDNQNSDLYLDNINDVSPSTILSLTCFLSELCEQNINMIKVVTYLPIRYKNKEIYYQKLLKYKLKKTNDESLLEQYEKQHLRIQQNLTDKFVRNFSRIVYHMSGVKILSYPMELDEYMTIKVDYVNCDNNAFLNEVLENRVKHIIK